MAPSVLLALGAGGDASAFAGTPPGGLPSVSPELWARAAQLSGALEEVLPTPFILFGGSILAFVLLLELLRRHASRTRGQLGVKLSIASGQLGEFRVRIARQPLPPFLHDQLDPRATARVRLGGRIHVLTGGGRLALGSVPAGAWYVAVAGFISGPLQHEVIGEFREEKCVRLRPGESRQVEFDFRPRFAHVRVRVTDNGAAVHEARVSRPGSGEPIKSTDVEGAADLEVPFGEAELCIGHDDRVLSMRVRVTPTGPESIDVDLASGGDRRIEGCAEAVEPLLRGDLSGAADALERAGMSREGSLFRAEHHLARGEIERAVEGFSKGGELLRAAELLEVLERWEEAADAFLQAGDALHAAKLFERSEAWERAGEAYAQAYLNEEAAACYERAGMRESALPLLERAGAYLRAGELAAELGQLARAEAAFGRIPEEHPDHAAARRRLEEIRDEGHGKASSSDPVETGEANAGSTAGASPAGKKRKRGKGKKSKPPKSAPPEEARAVPTGAAQRYEILEELGRGTMGIVFKAYDRALRRTVALKRLPRWMAASPRAVALFLDEARSAASLSHPHIVTVHDVVREGDTYFVTMEYLDGWTLRRLLERQGPMPAPEVVRVARQVLSALAYAHGREVIHRDIKTQNLMMTRQGIVKLTDFGLARVVAEMESEAPEKGSGTPCYVAPEQIEGRADARSDLYSLGVCLFELSTGQLPFTGPDLLEQQRSARRPRANEVLPTVPPLLANVIERLLAPDPGERFQTAEEALGVLEWLDR